ncbi:MAG: 4-(cytidine 5'-diphospho)-2-C-methyl-D-erythritol kinase [Cyanobacteria bacterium REEB459]|nr:4-(cytidine 5'-diphospho)-2-C-methyl-D-erythritol kinase [Cyanobacteria bacterium REEB459]
MVLYSLLAAAKVNLYLEIVGDRGDGFHELIMVMQSISLADRVTVRSIGVDTIRLICHHPLVPADETNLAYRAAALLVRRFPEVMTHRGGVEITLEKHIPVGAGLAGGSSNAAAVLVGLDLLWNLGLTQGELQELGAELGSDVPFAITGGTMFATGRGEQLDPLPGLHPLWMVLAKYGTEMVSTPWAYRTYRAEFGHLYQTEFATRRSQVKAGPMLAAISHHQGSAIGHHLYNDLEKVVLPAHGKTAELKATMASLGGRGTLMSGSGPTVFTLVSTQTEAESLIQRIRAALPDPDLGLWMAQCVPSGVQLVDD